MKAVVARKGVLGMEEAVDPTPGPGQVVVRPLACGICGSDLHLLETLESLGDSMPPVILGHEYVGEVVDYGPDTERRFARGSVVTAVPYLDHPGGPQLIGVSPFAGGALAERMLLQESRLIPVADSIPAEYAALAEPLAVGTHAVGVANLRQGDVPLVVGCGPVGLAVVAALKAAGHGPVVAADFSAVRRDLAATVGADVVVDPAESSPYAAWTELTGPEVPTSPLITEDHHLPTTVVFECVGVPGVIDTIIGSVPWHTRIVVVGACQQPDTFRPALAIMKELSLTFSYGYRPHEFAQSLRWVIDGRFDGNKLVTATRPLDRAAAAYAELKSSAAHCKILITPPR